MNIGLLRGTLAAIFCYGFATTGIAEEVEDYLAGSAPSAPASLDRSEPTLVETISTELKLQFAPAVRSTPAPKPWKGMFFDNDYSYLRDDEHGPLFGDRLKNIFIGDCGVLHYGGEFQARYMDDRNRFRPTYPARNDYTLLRWRQYLDYHHGDAWRLYVEANYATVHGNSLAPLSIDKNEFDLLNAFGDINLGYWFDRQMTFRFGRQELLYGAQRLISPLDWSNTRRTFEGFSLLTKGDFWDIDAFATRPVNIFPDAQDRPDSSRVFSGVYATYHGCEDATFEAYWLYLADNDTADINRSTVGGRWLAKIVDANFDGKACRTWLAEVEGGGQFGQEAGEEVRAAFLTAGLGHQWNATCWKPTVWLYYDWASGDEDPTDGINQTFNQLFPLGHKYFGFFDGLSRQNLIDYNVRVTAQPTDKLRLLAWFHWFDLDEGNDAVYNIAGAQFVPAGEAGGTNVGQELDLTAKYTFCPNVDLMVGHSWFWNGNALTGAVTPRIADGRFLWTQLTLRY